MVTCLEWVGNGKKIACVLEGADDSWTIPKDVINTYCYIMSTFILPKVMLIRKVGNTRLHFVVHFLAVLPLNDKRG